MAHVLVILGRRVRDPERDEGHPAEALFHAGPCVGHVRHVVQIREAVAADTVDFLLGRFGYFGEDHHGLDEADEDAGCGFGPGLEDRAADVGGEVV